MFEVGDVVVCVDASPLQNPFQFYINNPPVPPKKGAICKVTSFLRAPNGQIGVLINGEGPHCTLYGKTAWNPDRFRKLPPAEPEFIQLIRSLKAPTKIREDA